jgi:hypothetical protein
MSTGLSGSSDVPGPAEPYRRGMDIQETATPTRARAASSRAVGVVGLAATVLAFAGIGLEEAGGSATEPAFDAPDSIVINYLTGHDPTILAISGYVTVLGMIGLLWFAAGLAAVLRRAWPDGDWMAGVVLASGATMVGVLLVNAEDTAISFPAAPAAVEFFRAGGQQFANAWLGFASLALATAVTILRGRIAPSWLGWWAVVAGVGLVAVRAVWTNGIWLLPYGLFWFWVITISVRMVRGRRL